MTFTSQQLAILRTTAWPAIDSEELQSLIGRCSIALEDARPGPRLSHQGITHFRVYIKWLAHFEHDNPDWWKQLRVPFRPDCNWWARLQNPHQYEVRDAIRTCQSTLLSRVTAVMDKLAARTLTDTILAEADTVINNCCLDAPFFWDSLLANPISDQLPRGELKYALGRCNFIYAEHEHRLFDMPVDSLHRFRRIVQQLHNLAESEAAWSQLRNPDRSFGAGERHRNNGLETRQGVVLNQLEQFCDLVQKELSTDELERICNTLEEAMAPQSPAQHTSASLGHRAAFHPVARRS